MRFPFLLALLWLVDISRADVLGNDILKDVETILHNIAGRLNQIGAEKSRRQYSSGSLSYQPQPQSVNYGDVHINTNYGPIGKRSSVNYYNALYQQAVSHALKNSRQALTKRGYYYYRPPAQYAQNVNYGDVNINTNYGPIGKRDTQSSQHSTSRSVENKPRRHYSSGSLSYQPQPQSVNYGEVHINTNYGPIGKRSPVYNNNPLFQQVFYQPWFFHQQDHQEPESQTTQKPATVVTTAETPMKPQPTQPTGTNNHVPNNYVIYYNTQPVVANNNFGPIG